MADDKKTLKFQMMMSPNEADVLDDWMFKHRVRSRAEAIRRLWRSALVQEEIDVLLRKSIGEAMAALPPLLSELTKTPSVSKPGQNFIAANRDLVAAVLAGVTKAMHLAGNKADITSDLYEGDMALLELSLAERIEDFIALRGLFDLEPHEMMVEMARLLAEIRQETKDSVTTPPDDEE